MIDFDTFDAGRAITLRMAIDTGKLTFRGRKPTLALVQRWANPKRGCSPLGPTGPRIVLASVLTGRERMTMPAWVDEFVRERTGAMVQAARKLSIPPSPADLEKRSEAAKARMRAMGVKC